MSGVFESRIRWIWSLSISFRRLRRATSSWSPGRLRGKHPDAIVQLAMLGPQRVEIGRGIVVAHPVEALSPCRRQPEQPSGSRPLRALAADQL